MSSHPPRVALAMPVYNGAAYLPQALAALQAQTEPDWTAFVTDNASTDETPDLVRAAAAEDPRIRYIRNPSNVGANGNFNRSMALAVASGAPFVKWAAHDDRPHPAYLERCLAALAAAPDAVGAHTHIQLIDGCGVPFVLDEVRGGFAVSDTDTWSWTPAKAAALADPRAARRMAHFLRSKPGEWMVYGVYRAQTVAGVQPLDMPGVEDLFGVEMLLRGPVAVAPEVLFDHRLHDCSARHLSRRDYIAYETGRKPRGLVLPSAGRALAFAGAIRRSPLRGRARRDAWKALAAFALGARRFRKLVVPGPDNYLGLNFGRSR